MKPVIRVVLALVAVAGLAALGYGICFVATWANYGKVARDATIPNSARAGSVWTLTVER